MIRIENANGDNDVYLEDWAADVDRGNLRGGVGIKIFDSHEAATDFTPDQARGFARELLAAADRAEGVTQR